ncbi:uncharacterized protein LOC116303554 [Actinia tenebrosa]|uniref:Uncharacterized protein LOC116303554 n=1 Tax=Actinia tenebrosa TaxID=6105 RepID=A0A6P8IQ10_ACTTE|nr:uncharacterized protein LOC116303554 [Actinia tenebrosa]
MCRSRVLLVTFVVAVALQSILAQAQPKCSSILETSCTSNAECACSGPRTFVCNYKNKCNRISIIDIMRRQRPCANIFKQFCNTDDDCPCKKAKYVCEDRECVMRVKPRRESQQ